MIDNKSTIALGSSLLSFDLSDLIRQGGVMLNSADFHKSPSQPLKSGGSKYLTHDKA